MFICSVFFPSGPAFASELSLQELIGEALEKNPDIRASQSRVNASRYRIPQAESLPDPMFMFGYQNEGWERYTYGEMPDSQWMFSASQMFPFPGKRSLRGNMASRDSESLAASHASLRLNTVAKIKELYYELFLAYKSLDLIKDRTALFSQVEEAAIARYSSGMGPQQEVIMAQTEKYMLMEKEEMQRQKIQSLEAMLNSAVGRDVNTPMGKPVEIPATAYSETLDETIATALANSPDIKARAKMIESSEAAVRMSKKEYYPDFTITGSVFTRGGEFEDMWSLTTALNIPLFYRTKQRQAVNEAEANLSGARHEYEASKLMISSGIRDNYAMVKAAEKLVDLYANALIPKATQDFELALTGYRTGRVEAITLILTLKSLIDFELSYWEQFAAREKAIARLESLAGAAAPEAVEEKR